MGFYVVSGLSGRVFFISVKTLNYPRPLTSPPRSSQALYREQYMAYSETTYIRPFRNMVSAAGTSRAKKALTGLRKPHPGSYGRETAVCQFVSKHSMSVNTAYLLAAPKAQI